MCRIAGIIAKGQEKELEERVKAMCTLMAHGGPDDEGYFYQQREGLYFGHRRLALIDLSKNGHQPMKYGEDQFIISFNGEIYNYLILRKELEQEGYRFQSDSDTEVILVGFVHWGMLIFEKLNGMFAFALFDSIARKTYLVRDRVGIKPLYYSISEDKLVFASEVKAFEGIDEGKNDCWKILFLAFGHIPEPFTTRSNVFALQKGCYLLWDHHTCKATIAAYVVEHSEVRISDKEEAEHQLFRCLKAAVERQLRADSAIGVFLSGGIDSSIITLLADQLQHRDRRPLHTISVNFNEDEFSERVYQRAVLQEVRSHHSAFTLTQQTFDEHFPEALAAMDQPTADGINSWFINYYAKKEGLKGVLSGLGADELFGGYPSFWRMRLVNLLTKLPGFLFKTGRILKSTIGKRGYYLSYQNHIGKYLFLRGIFAPDEIAKLLNLSICEVNDVLRNLPLPRMPESLTPPEQASWLEYNVYMQNQLLKDTDFMSMQHGVEVRVPFLDNEVISLVRSISSSIKYPPKKKKALLVDSFIKLLPEKIWNRPKMGFTFPFERWLLQNEHFNAGLAQCESKKGIELIADFKKGKLHWSKAMALYLVLAHA